MLIGIDGKYEDKYEAGLKKIEEVKEQLEQNQPVDVRVLESLEELKQFWCSENLFFDFGTDCRTDLYRALEYFSSRRKIIKFSDWNKICQDLIAKLQALIIEDEDMKVIEKINDWSLYGVNFAKRKGSISEKFFTMIESRISGLLLEEKYAKKDNKWEIARCEYVAKVVKECGVSDSYIASILYEKIWDSLERGRCGNKEDKLQLIKYLELYRHTVNTATESLEELLDKYNGLED